MFNFKQLGKIVFIFSIAFYANLLFAIINLASEEAEKGRLKKEYESVNSQIDKLDRELFAIIAKEEKYNSLKYNELKAKGMDFGQATQASNELKKESIRKKIALLVPLAQRYLSYRDSKFYPYTLMYKEPLYTKMFIGQDRQNNKSFMRAYSCDTEDDNINPQYYTLNSKRDGVKRYKSKHSGLPDILVYKKDNCWIAD